MLPTFTSASVAQLIKSALLFLLLKSLERVSWPRASVQISCPGFHIYRWTKKKTQHEGYSYLSEELILGLQLFPELSQAFCHQLLLVPDPAQVNPSSTVAPLLREVVVLFSRPGRFWRGNSTTYWPWGPTADSKR